MPARIGERADSHPHLGHDAGEAGQNRQGMQKTDDEGDVTRKGGHSAELVVIERDLCGLSSLLANNQSSFTKISKCVFDWSNFCKKGKISKNREQNYKAASCKQK